MKTFNRYGISGILLLSQLYSLNAFSWGTVGHRTSAQIALNILKEQNSPALLEVQKILKSDDFVDCATWADEARASDTENWKATSWYHFEKMHDDEKYVPHLNRLTADERSRGGAIQAILASETMMLDPQSSEADRNYALKFMIHFIGDIHQPLHSGRVEDNGGNKTNMRWLGSSMSLHSVWDSQMIALGHKELFNQGSKPEQIINYATYLQNKFKSVPFADQNTLKYDDWIHESMVPRADAYKYKSENAYKYTARFIDIVDQRIYLAGLRIAYTLNRIFPGYQGPNMPTAAGQARVQQFRLDINSIIGDFMTIINLRPAPMR